MQTDFFITRNGSQFRYIYVLEKLIYSVCFIDNIFSNILRFLDEKSSISFTDILHIRISNHNKGELELWKRNYHLHPI